MIYIILLTMFFLHIVDDYYLQGILAQMKQRCWWQEHVPDEQYKNDYVMALIEHGFSWTFMIHIPFFLMVIFGGYQIHWTFPVFTFFWNWICHSIIDHMKANIGCINLVEDQIVHIVQTILTWGILFVR